MTALPPGSAIGVLGGGQLGRMMALAAARLGYRVHVFTPEADSPAAQVSAAATVARWDDLGALDAFAEQVDAVTLEFENVPVSAVERLAEKVPVRPGAKVLAVAQDRLREKTVARELGVPVAPFEPVTSDTDLADAIAAIGAPAVLKTRREGYDGKGQRMIRKAADAAAAFDELGRPAAILESFVEFTSEISVIAARGVDGEVRCYPAVENRHRNHILSLTIAPSPGPSAASKLAEEATRALIEALDVVGLLAVEFFVTPEEGVLFNEMAPRPHNSGHWTIEACRVSQFEQQVRATAGLPLGAPGFHHRAVMRNLIGDDAKDWARLAAGDVSLHLYGKAEVRPGRKMGHVTKLYAPDRPAWPPKDTELP
ncbi:MAG: 5-(carboxyamino)imidazole ribonucleotide synthase [Rhizobiales bacterium NRL2]|jgi:5-(carboxyamino)imidazole ribonucleotide synthase|nr:MAG: 5-(carboxyamino)imidazole ribonucleotide synthase [Rhizobiales bacterium NRL2]